MAISHVFLSPQADFTGTVTIWNGSGTQTQAATDIVRPSNWNSVHNVGYILSGNTVGGSTGSGTDIIFQGGANLTLSGVGNTIVFSAAAGGGAGDGGNVLAAGTQTAASTGTVLFTNANGISFGMNNSSVITASYTVPTQSVQTQNQISVLGSTGGISFANSNGITFGGNASTITASHNGLTSQSVQTQNQISVLGSTGGISFANGNGITFGGNASTITASHNGLTSQSNQAVSAGNGSSAFQTLSFADSNGVSWSTAAGGIIATVKTDYLTSQSNQALSGSNGSFTFQTATFGNLNGMSFYTSNGSLVGSYTVPTVTNSSWTVSDNATSGSVARLAFTNLNGVTLSLSSGAAGSHTIVGSHNGLTSQSNQALSASNGSFTFQTAAFSNANNVTFGTSAGSIITASVAAQSVQTQSLIAAVFDGVASISTGTIRFTNANGVSFSINGQTLSGSVAAQTNQTAGLYALGNTTQNSSTTLDARTLSFNGLGIVTAGFSNGSIQISATQSNQALSASNGSFAFQTAGFSNANNVTFGTSAGSIITASVAAQSVQTQSLIAAVFDGVASISTGTIRFANANGVSFSINGQTLSGSVAAQTAQTVGLYALGNTTQNSSTTLDARTLSFNGLGIVTAGFSNGSIQISATQSAQTLGGYAVGNTTGASSSSTVDARSFSIQGAGAASVGFTNGSWVVSAPNAAAGNVTFSAGTTSNGLANIVFSNSNGVSFGLDGSTITASVNAGGGGSLNVSAGTTSNNLTNIVFSNSNGVTFGLDGSTITASIPAPRLSSYFYPIDGGLTAISIPIQGQMSVQRLICPVNISASRYGILCSMSPVTSGDNRTFSFVASHWFGIYSDNAGTLSSMTSTSAAYTNGTWSSSNTNSANSMRQLSFAVDINMTPGVYYIMNAMSTRVISTSTSSQTVAAMNMTLHGIAVLTANNYADLGVVTNSRVNQFFSGFGLYATTTNAVPATIDLTGLNVTGTNVARANLAFIMRN